SLRVINGTSEVNLSDAGFLLVAVDTNGLGPGTAVEVVVETSGAVGFGYVLERTELDWSCDSSGNPRRCMISYLPQGESAEFNIDFNALEIGSGKITVTVNGGNDPNAANDSIAFPVTVPPAVDLVSSVTVDAGRSHVDGAEVFRSNELVTLSGAVENLSDSAATGVEVDVRFDIQASDYQIDWPGVSCT